MSPNVIIWIVFFIYMLGMLWIGWVAYRRTQDHSDYLLGGRKLNSAVTALSAGASDMSGWLLLGLPGYAYLSGLSAGWIALGLIIGTYCNWKFIAKKLRIFTAAMGNSLTLSEFFENRFNDRSRLLRTATAIFILVFFLFYTSSGLVAGGKLFNSLFGVPYVWGVVLGGAAVLIYTFMGGFFAVCWTDAVQGLLMSLALVIVPVVAVVYQGGIGHALDAMRSVSPAMLNPFMDGTGKAVSLLSIISLLAWGLGYFGQPHILVRFMAISSSDKIPSARKIGMWWVFFCLIGALVVGFAGVGAVQTKLQGADSEKVFIVLIQNLLHPVLTGVCMSAILAAIMSTASSQLLVCSSALTEDIYKPFVRKNAKPKELMWVGRFSVLFISLCAFLLSLNPASKVLDLVAFAWGGFGAAFGPTIILCLLWKRMTLYGAFAGILVGGVMVFVWDKMLKGGIFDVYEIVPGFIFSMIAIVVVSLLSKPPQNIDHVFSIKEM